MTGEGSGIIRRHLASTKESAMRPAAVATVRPPLFEPLEGRQLLSAGDLDATFGDAGKVLTDRGLGMVQQVVVQRDGKIVAAVSDDRYAEFAVVRYADGTLDETFGDRGVATFDLGEGGDFARCVAVLPDGRIAVGARRRRTAAAS
jgi:hypothetical protein